MPVNATIGKLNVLIGGSAKELEGVLGGAEKRIAGFAAKASAPLNNIAAGLTRLPGMILSPYTALAAGAGAVASQLVPLGQAALKTFMPGGEIAAARMGVDEFFGGFEEKAQRGIDRMRHFQRESRRFGVGPQFIAGLERLAGPDGEITGKVLDKVLEAQAKLRTDGNFAKSLQPFFKDVNALKSMNTEEFFFAIADAMSKIGDQAGKLDFLGQFTGNKLADDAFFHFAGGSAAIKGAIGKVSAGGAFLAGNTIEDKAIREYERDLKQAEYDREAAAAMQQQARAVSWQMLQKDSGPLSFFRYMDRSFFLSTGKTPEQHLNPLHFRGFGEYDFSGNKTEAARAFLQKEGYLGKQPDRVDAQALENARQKRVKQEQERQERETLDKSEDAFFRSKRLAALRRQGYAPWEAELRNEDWFDKRPPWLQKRAIQDAQREASRQFEYANRSPLERARDDLRDIASHREASNLAKGRAVRDVLNGLGFGNIRVGGPASLIEAGSQAAAALQDQISGRAATEKFQNDPKAWEEFLRQAVAENARTAKAAEAMGPKLDDMLRLLEDGMPGVLKIGPN